MREEIQIRVSSRSSGRVCNRQGPTKADRLSAAAAVLGRWQHLVRSRSRRRVPPRAKAVSRLMFRTGPAGNNYATAFQPGIRAQAKMRSGSFVCLKPDQPGRPEQQHQPALGDGQEAGRMDHRAGRFEGGPGKSRQGGANWGAGYSREYAASPALFGGQMNGTISRPGGAEPLLRAMGLSKSYGGVQAAKDVTFDLFEGEILALAGDGAGKSTVIGMLGGARPNAGKSSSRASSRAFIGPPTGFVPGSASSTRRRDSSRRWTSSRTSTSVSNRPVARGSSTRGRSSSGSRR